MRAVNFSTLQKRHLSSILPQHLPPKVNDDDDVLLRRLIEFITQTKHQLSLATLFEIQEKSKKKNWKFQLTVGPYTSPTDGDGFSCLTPYPAEQRIVSENVNTNATHEIFFNIFNVFFPPERGMITGLCVCMYAKLIRENWKIPNTSSILYRAGPSLSI